MGATSPLKQEKTTGISNSLLIPVDFSDMSMIAVRVGFQLAVRLNLIPVLLHAFIVQDLENDLPSNPMFPSMDAMETIDTIEEVREDNIIRKDASKSFGVFSKKIKDLQKGGKISDIKFSTLLQEGMPEEVIRAYCRMQSPSLVVMATRGLHKRRREFIGSVTAEVIDNCRVPVFTVPENYAFNHIAEIDKIAVFCNLMKNDDGMINDFLKLFSFPALDLWLLPVADKMDRSKAAGKLENLLNFLRNKYPESTFHSSEIVGSLSRSDCEEIFEREKLQLIVVPNKKQNILSRLFNPGIAHKILFEEDVPMLAIPV